MSRRQSDRASRFQIEIEQGIRVAATMFRDNDPDASVRAVWWTSRLRGRRFATLVRQAREITQERISLGVVERGEAGQRKAMPYFFAVLQDLVKRHRHADADNSTP
jgi:hypothetical protein